MSEKFQAVVIGGGPGGYVCAIRLAQLGLKTACIESRGSLGGTCLNIGCIPSKSLLNLSEEFHKVKSLANKGIEVGEVKLNLDKMMKSKDKAVTILTKGVEFLLKKNKVTYFKGHGSFKSKNEILIKDDKNKETIIQTEKTVIATGSVPVSLPGIEIDEKIITKKSSPHLWPNHEAEYEIGVEYEQIDTILYCLIDKKLSVEDTAKESQIDMKIVEKIYSMYKNSEHKRINPKAL